MLARFVQGAIEGDYNKCQVGMLKGKQRTTSLVSLMMFLVSVYTCHLRCVPTCAYLMMQSFPQAANMNSVLTSVQSLMQMFDGKAKEFTDEIENVHMVWLEEIQQEANRMFSR